LTEFGYGERRLCWLVYAKCRLCLVPFSLSVTNKPIVMNAIIPNAVMHNSVMLSVVVPIRFTKLLAVLCECKHDLRFNKMDDPSINRYLDQIWYIHCFITFYQSLHEWNW